MAIDSGTLSQLLSLEMAGNAGAQTALPTTIPPQKGNAGFSNVLNTLMFLIGEQMLQQNTSADALSAAAIPADTTQTGTSNTGDMLWQRLATSGVLSSYAAEQGTGSISSVANPVQSSLNTGGISSEPAQSVYSGIIDKMGKKYSVDAGLIESVIAAESGGNPNATSSSGAQGLMQLMPSTALSLGVSDPYDPAQNIEGGTKYLKKLLDQFNGSTSLALAAYNAGAGNVAKYGGVPPFAETQAYVSRVMNGFSNGSAKV